MGNERLLGYEYFLVSYVHQHEDFMIRQVDPREELVMLGGEKSIVVGVPRPFLEEFSPREVGEKLAEIYRIQRGGPSSVYERSIQEIRRYFSDNGISLSNLLAATKKESTRELAQVCLKTRVVSGDSAAVR